MRQRTLCNLFLVRRKQIFFSCILVGLVIIGSLILAEILFRAIGVGPLLRYGYFPEFPYLFDPFVGWKHKPNKTFEIRMYEYNAFFHTNSLGFRSSQEFEKGDVDNLVIAILGDSFVQAIQIDERCTFPKLLESKLTSYGRVYVQNYGVSHLGLVHYLQMYRYYVRPHSPHIVLICIYGNNDFRNSSPELEITDYLRPHYKINKGDIMDVLPFDNLSPKKIECKLSNQSKKINLLLDEILERQQVVFLKIRRWLILHSALCHFINKEIAKFKLMRSPIFPMDAYIYEQPYQSVWNKAWCYGIWCLDQLILECQEDGAIPIVVLVPGMWETNPKVWKMLQAAYRKLGGQGFLDKEKVRRNLKEHCTRKKVHFLDLSDTFRHAYTLGLSPYYKKDMHWNAEGHRLAARKIYEYLFEKQIIPSLKLKN